MQPAQQRAEEAYDEKHPSEKGLLLFLVVVVLHQIPRWTRTFMVARPDRAAMAHGIRPPNHATPVGWYPPGAGNHPLDGGSNRSIAQPGRALVWGTRGHGFKSPYSDHTE